MRARVTISARRDERVEIANVDRGFAGRVGAAVGARVVTAPDERHAKAKDDEK
jgi:hypothetical protein